eukprot:9467469-Pyramimonas_sp.AAC.1
MLERCGLAFEFLVALRTRRLLLGLFWAVLEPPWAVPEPSLGLFGRPGRPRVFRGPSWAALGFS